MGIKRAAKAAKGAKDFTKKKHKVGRKLKPAQNDTTVDFKVKQLNLPSQTALDGNESVPTSDKNLTLKVRLWWLLPCRRFQWHCQYFSETASTVGQYTWHRSLYGESKVNEMLRH
jgi:hypothetical protein